jgi:hypothetical protein
MFKFHEYAIWLNGSDGWLSTQELSTANCLLKHRFRCIPRDDFASHVA